MLNLIQTGGGAGASGTFPSTIAKVSHQWLDSYNSVTGLFTASQPDFTDLTGTASTAQIPNLAASKITSGLLALANGGTNVDLSATGGATSFLAQNASHVISARVIAGADLPNPSSSTLGGIQSLASVASKWINTISTAGVPSATQPAFSDISGQADLTSQVTGVLPPANGGVAVVSTTKQGYLVGGGAPLTGLAAVTGAQLVSAGQKVRVIQMVVPYKITITKASVRISTVVAAATATVGIYSADGNTKLLDSGTFDASLSTKQTKSGLSCTLNPGVYWYVWSASTQTTLQGACIPTGIGTSITESASITPLFGEAANSATSGVLPATLGAITAVAFNVFFCVFEP